MFCNVHGRTLATADFKDDTALKNIMNTVLNFEKKILMDN